MKKYAKDEVWTGIHRRLCVFNEDGTATFAEDVNEEELKTAIVLLLRQRQIDDEIQQKNMAT